MNDEFFHLAFWALALMLLAAVAASTLAGWRAIRQGDVSRHQRWMNSGAWLVALFLALYVVKVLNLGREDLSTWGPGSLALLYTHESFVAVMLLATTGARWLSYRLRQPNPSGRVRKVHRWLGRVGAVAVLLALVSAFALFLDMLDRAKGSSQPSISVDRSSR